MIRLILLFVCGYLVWAGIAGLWVNISTGRHPAVINLADIAAYPGKALPHYLEVRGGEANFYVCTFNASSQTKAADGSQRCKRMIAPLLTPEQASVAAEGKSVTASVVVEADNAVTERCNNSTGGDCLKGVAFRGVTLGSVLNGLDEADRTQLTRAKIVLDRNTAYLKMQSAPRTVGKNALEIIGGIVGGFILIVSFARTKSRAEPAEPAGTIDDGSRDLSVH